MKLKSIFIYVAAPIVVWAGLANTVEAQRFQTVRQALASHFQSSDRVTFVQIQPRGEQRGAIERRLGRALEEDRYTFYVATSGERVDGYALFDEERGQHEMISFGTFFDAAGSVTDVVVMAYREPYGDGIRAERFRQQFVGRSASSRFRPGRDIDTVSGSTISSRSMARAVRRASVLLATMVLPPRLPGEALARATPRTSAR